MASTRGVIISIIERYLRKEFGPQGWELITAELTPEERRLVAGPIAYSVPYPLSLHMRLLEVPRRLFGATRPQIAREIGRQVAEESIDQVFRMFIRLGRPGFVISRGAMIWKSYFDFGDLRVVRNEPRFMQLQMHCDAPTNTAFCESLCGWAEQAVTISGGRNTQARETACQHHGAPNCVVEMSWA